MPPGLLYFWSESSQRSGVLHHRGIGGGSGRVFGTAAAQPAITEARVVRSVVLELPAEDLLIELLGPTDIRRAELDVVHLAVMVARRHSASVGAAKPQATAPRGANPGERQEPNLIGSARQPSRLRPGATTRRPPASPARCVFAAPRARRPEPPWERFPAARGPGGDARSSCPPVRCSRCRSPRPGGWQRHPPRAPVRVATSPRRG